MSDIERAKLIPVSGNNDTPDMNSAIDVQFNPTSLKVSMSNTLKENSRNSNSRSSQLVDKSSSNLTVELIFDTTYVENLSSSASTQTEQGNTTTIAQGSDVRIQTRKIADKFMKPVKSGNKMLAPSRLLFQWGAFEFIGMVQSFDETLDFFSAKGRPLRATVSLKLSEDRYQFRSNDSDKLNADQTPSLVFTNAPAPQSKTTLPGSNNTDGRSLNTADTSKPVPGGSSGPGNWRDNALFNGIESPRLPKAPALALPLTGPTVSQRFTAPGNSVSAPTTVSFNTNKQNGNDTKVAATQFTNPAFKYGNSSALGTNISGAFAPVGKGCLTASNILANNESHLAISNDIVSASTPLTGKYIDRTSNAAIRESSRPGTATTDRVRGITIAALLDNTDPSSVGFN